MLYVHKRIWCGLTVVIVHSTIREFGQHSFASIKLGGSSISDFPIFHSEISGAQT